MLRYSKTLSLALLISIPVIAMEDQGTLVTTTENIVLHETVDLLPLASQLQEENLSKNPLANTVVFSKSLAMENQRLQKLADERKDLDKQETEARKNLNKAIDDLLQSKKTKELALKSTQTLITETSAKLLALQTERDNKVKELAAKKIKDLAKFNTDKDKELTKINDDHKKEQDDYNKNADDREKAFKAQKDKAESDQKTFKTKITEIEDTLQKIKNPPAQQKSVIARLLGY